MRTLLKQSIVVQMQYKNAVKTIFFIEIWFRFDKLNTVLWVMSKLAFVPIH